MDPEVVGALVRHRRLARRYLAVEGHRALLANVTAMLALTVIGAALYLAGSIARVLRLWLLRQSYEAQEQSELIASALRSR